MASPGKNEEKNLKNGNKKWAWVWDSLVRPEVNSTKR
jgi:hypothetical protein